MRFALIGEIFDIYPVGSIDHVLSRLSDIFDDRDTSCLAVTYSINADVVHILHNIAPNLRIFCGKATKPEHIRGAYVTPAQTHFKGIMMWSNAQTAYYIGSSNLTHEAAGNYGIIVVKPIGFDEFDVKFANISKNMYYDPFERIFTDIVFRETKGVCEYTGKRFNKFILDKGRFRGVG